VTLLELLAAAAGAGIVAAEVAHRVAGRGLMSVVTVVVIAVRAMDVAAGLLLLVVHRILRARCDWRGDRRAA